MSFLWDNTDATSFRSKNLAAGTPTDGQAYVYDAASDTFILDNVITTQRMHGEIYMQDNADDTAIALVDTPIKIEGAFTSGSLLTFSHGVNGRLTYDGTITRKFTVIASISMLTAGNNKTITMYVAKNNSVEAKTGMSRKVGSANDVGSSTLSGVIELAQDDFIEVFAENNTDSTNVTVEDINLCIG